MYSHLWVTREDETATIDLLQFLKSPDGLPLRIEKWPGDTRCIRSLYVLMRESMISGLHE